MLNVLIVYLIQQCRIPNLVGWWLLQTQLVYMQSTDGKVGGAEGKTDVPVKWHIFLTITTQIFLTLVPIVCFVAIQTRTRVTRMGMRWPLCEYSTSNRCLHYLVGVCDKRDNDWSHCIHAIIEHIPCKLIHSLFLQLFVKLLGPSLFSFIILFVFFLRLIITCRLWVIYVREDNYSNV